MIQTIGKVFFISLYGKEQIMNLHDNAIKSERVDNKIKEEKGDKK